jgi:agmatine deiminase
MEKRLLLILLISLSISFTTHSQRRMVAEWEPAHGTLIRWPLGIPGNLVAELAGDDSLYVLVRNLGEQTQAISTFQAYGVNLDHCRFIIAPTYSHWTRDWGPHYVFDEAGQACIADPIFDGYPWVPGCNNSDPTVNLNNHRGYEEDDAVNAVLAQFFGLPLISLPIYLTGGNVMTDGSGYAVSTRQMLDENAHICDEACFMAVTTDSLGLPHYFIAENPEVYGIQHIDCYAKLIGEEKIMVKQVPAWHPEYACVEELATFLGDQTGCYGRKYEIVRVFCPAYSGNSVAAYTNSLIINKKVLVPLFGISGDEEALDTYRDAMPGYEVIGFTGSWYHYDALHCRTMGIFDPHMLVMRHKPPLNAVANLTVTLTAKIDDRSEAGLIPEHLRLFWRVEGNMLWENLLLTPATQTDTFYAVLPGFPEGTELEYYFAAADSSGRQERLPRTAPGGYYRLDVSNIMPGVEEIPQRSNLRVSPVPANDIVLISYNPAGSGWLKLAIYDIHGKQVWNDEIHVNGNIPVFLQWHCENAAAGIYILKTALNGEIQVVKIIKN